ncbi:MAG: hypothetical protein M9904_18240 [Chitinophagaceae bacterium]|nr:hypothetical protein [Chitinophagaceae bacterium]
MNISFYQKSNCEYFKGTDNQNNNMPDARTFKGEGFIETGSTRFGLIQSYSKTTQLACF